MNGNALTKQVDIRPRRPELEELPSAIREIDTIVKNKHEREMLLFLSEQYKELFLHTDSVCEYLKGFDEACCLLDFDVVQQYLMVAPLNTSQPGVGTLAVEYFFQEGAMSYSLPLGAYREMLLFVGESSRMGAEISVLESGVDESLYSPVEVFRQLANRLEIPDADTADLDDLELEILERVDSTIIHLGRLVSMLRNGRFRGVYLGFSHSDAESWTDLLNASKFRRYERDRERNRNDGINLATVTAHLVNQIRGSEVQDRSVGYILMSQTIGILHILSVIEHEAAPAKIAESRIAPDISSHRSRFPVYSPKDILYCELLGGVTQRSEAIETQRRCWQFNRQFEKIHRALSDIDRDEGSSAIKQAIAGFDDARQLELKELIGGISESFRDKNARLRAVEQRRSLESYIESTMGKPLAGDERKAELLRRSVSFARLLSEVGDALSSRPTPNSECLLQEPTYNRPFIPFAIFRDPSREDKLCVGELYYLNPKYGSIISHFSLRWKAACDDLIFLRTLDETWSFPGWEFKEQGETLRICRSQGPEWGNGAILATSIGNLSVPRSVFFECLKSRTLSPLLKAARSFYKETTGGLTLNSIRLSSLCNTIYYDIVPTMSSTRTIALMSESNVAPQAVAMLRATSAHFIRPGELDETLANLLGCLPNPIQ